MVQAVQLTQDVQIVQVVQPLRGACPEKALTKRDLTEKDEYVVERYGFFDCCSVPRRIRLCSIEPLGEISDLRIVAPIWL
jgi:hypothetical protein